MQPGSSSVVARDVEGAQPVGASSLAALAGRWTGPALVFVTVLALAADQGGYFSTSWGWAAFGALWVLGLWLMLGGAVEVGLLDLAAVALFGLLAAWVALSLLWTESSTATVLDVERMLVYLSVVAAVLVVARRSDLYLLAGSLLGAIVLVSSYALSTRLFPDRLGVFDSVAAYRLAEPVGYWNGLGIFVAVGALLAVGFAVRGRYIVSRIVAAACLTLLLPTLYFTFSRGAWAALAIGVAVALLYDPRRQQLAAWLLVLLPAPALATWIATRSDALTHTGAPLKAAVHDGHHLARLLLLFLLLSVASSAVGILLERRLRPLHAARLAFAALLVALPVLAAIVVLVHYGGPSGLASKAYDSFRSAPVELTQKSPNLNKRLFSLSSNGRIDLWHVAWVDYEHHSALGSGSGTYGRHWASRRPVTFNAQDAHGAYIEALAELGPVGLALLVAAFLVPLAAAFRARSHPLASSLLAGYVALILHAGVDWDLEQTGVALAGILCGVGLLVAARRERQQVSPIAVLRFGSVAVALLLAGFALFGLLGNSALASSKSARDDHDWRKAANQARRARHYMPWSSKPWEALGFAQSASGDIPGAKESFRRAIAKDSGDWVLWYDLAAVSKGVERRHALARARRLNPRSSELQTLASRSG